MRRIERTLKLQLHLVLGVEMIRLDEDRAADVVDQHVDAAIGGDCLVDQFLGAGKGREIDQHLERLDAMLLQLGDRLRRRPRSTRSATTMVPPSSPSRFAAARPMPCPAPVTMQILPLRRRAAGRPWIEFGCHRKHSLSRFSGVIIREADDPVITRTSSLAKHPHNHRQRLLGAPPSRGMTAGVHRAKSTSAGRIYCLRSTYAARLRAPSGLRAWLRRTAHRPAARRSPSARVASPASGRAAPRLFAAPAPRATVDAAP